MQINVSNTSKSGHSLTVILMILMILLVLRCIGTVDHVYSNVTLRGENSIGEASKVFFARRVLNDRTIFLPPFVKPYLPSQHGPLVHLLVGWVGKLTGCGIDDLYFIGRGISILCFLMTMSLLAWWLRRIGVSWVAWGMLLLLLLGNTRLVGHLASYRPDQWIAFLSVLVFVLVAEFPRRPWALAVLICLPTVAFLIKPATAGLSAVILIALLMQGHRRRALVCGLGIALVLAMSLALVETLSEAMYFRSLLSGLRMPMSWRYAVANLSQPEIWPGVLLPLLLVGWVWKRDHPGGRYLRLLWLFWLCECLFATICCMRAGSNVYYYLNTMTYAMLLLVIFVLEHLSLPRWRWEGIAHGKGSRILLGGLLLGLLLSHGRASWNLLQRPDFEIADRITYRFAGSRQQVANWINQKKLICYSDDASLNVLLAQPQIVSPLVHTTLVQGGGLPAMTMYGPVHEQEYDVMVMTGVSWAYLGTVIPPCDFLNEVVEHYQMLPRHSDRDYVIFVRRTGKVIKVPDAFVGQAVVSQSE